MRIAIITISLLVSGICKSQNFKKILPYIVNINDSSFEYSTDSMIRTQSSFLVLSNNFDTISLQSNSSGVIQNNPYRFILTKYDEIIFYVDTSVLISTKFKNDFVKSYPVFIYNQSSKRFLITTQFGSLPMITEALDEFGEWKPIEYFSYSWCWDDMFGIPLLPGYFILTNTIKYHGEYETKLRLKIKIKRKIYYSNIFIGSIKKSQLEKRRNIPKRDSNFTFFD